MEKEQNGMKIYAFDFDGTLTRRDTFVEFIRHVYGMRRTLCGFLRFAPLLVLMKLGRYPNWKAKQRVFSWFFRGMAVGEFDTHCARFASTSRQLLRADGFSVVRQAVREGSQVVVISASVDRWVRPFFSEFDGHVAFACTEIEVQDGRVTGRFLTPNCYGAEKPRRLLRLFPQRAAYRLVAFGDSRGDQELIEAADAGYFRTRDGLLHRRKGEPDAMVEACLASVLASGNTSEKKDLGKKTLGEIIRFGIVGVTATLLQYGFYLLILNWLHPAVANTLAYLLSFTFNYVASTRFTFRVKSSVKRGAGFAFSHLVNYTMQTVLLMLFLYVGMPKQWALIPVFCVCVPVNFLLVRHFLRK
mgnify:CR=1 FL=1